MKIRITTKLLIILILTALVPLLIIGWVGYRSTLNISTIASEANREIADLAMSDSSAALFIRIENAVNGVDRTPCWRCERNFTARTI